MGLTTEPEKVAEDLEDNLADLIEKGDLAISKTDTPRDNLPQSTLDALNDDEELKPRPGKLAYSWAYSNGYGLGNTLVSTIQGSGSTSPHVGEEHQIEAVVTAIHPNMSGFYVQEEEADSDGNVI